MLRVSCCTFVLQKLEGGQSVNSGRDFTRSVKMPLKAVPGGGGTSLEGTGGDLKADKGGPRHEWPEYGTVGGPWGAANGGLRDGGISKSEDF